MRDLNDEILDNPFDEEMKSIVAGFAALLKPMIEAIDLRGLKKYFLRKHLVDVDRFYRFLDNSNFNSETATKCKRRFEKNRDKLLSFFACPCGYLGDPTHSCSCTPGQIQRYRRKISGPLLDRIDIHVEVPAVPYKDLSSDYAGERSSDIRERVAKTRQLQLERFKKDRIFCNGQMKTRHIKKFCRLRDDALGILETAMQKLGLSAKAYARILKLSRTIADLESSEDIHSHHIAEAIQYRTLDRGQF